jgi:hypothetical protein
MKKRSFLYLFAFAALILAVGLACSALSPTPTAEPVNIPPTQEPPAPTSESSSTSIGSDLVTFTDQNNYYQIDVPGDWKYSQSIDKTSNHYYIDQFKSPDENAVIENIVYDDGTAFVGSENGKFALYLLNTFYSSTGKEGDIRVSGDSIQKDGSERLTWTSKGGGYSGTSYFEVRNKTTFLMFTVDWFNDYQSTYIDVLDRVISSYRLP